MDNIFVARQPIYNKSNQVFGYELLYRASDSDVADFSDGDLASSEVILNSFVNVGLDNLVGSAEAFINITEEFVLNESLTPMFENQTVLEVLEHIKPTKEVIIGVKRLKDQGYKIALDDFEYSPEYDELLLLADYVKLDVMQLTTSEVVQQIKYLEPFDIKLVAEKVETPEMFAFCKKLDFDYFQGFYFCKPQLVKRKHIPANKLVVLDIFKKLENPEFDFDEIEKTIAQDAVLTFKLLRYVNSATFVLRKEIESIREALVLIGGDAIKKWVTLILMTQLAEGKPQTLLVTALVRARMCELVAGASGKNNEQMFIIGLLSLLDALMDMKMIDLLDELSLSASIKYALLDYEGENGETLMNVILYEQGKWNELVKHGVDAQYYFSCYVDAVKWADSTIESLL
ncbi:MAG: HDOD domain-containing protein [Gammaproteobacteria bacterium]|nr:HDOD domain-containing protein [Gammaproteobacteria bacterium]